MTRLGRVLEFRPVHVHVPVPVPVPESFDHCLSSY
jgi:hypothetical protein